MIPLTRHDSRVRSEVIWCMQRLGSWVPSQRSMVSNDVQQKCAKPTAYWCSRRLSPLPEARAGLNGYPPQKKSAGNASASQLPPRGISALVAVSEMVSRMGDIKYLAKHGQTLRGQPLCIAERLDSLYHVVSFVMVQPCSTGNQFNICSSWAVEAHMWNSYSS